MVVSYINDGNVNRRHYAIFKALEKLARLRVWLFLYATRLVEFINALLIIGFSTAFLVDAHERGRIAREAIQAATTKEQIEAIVF